MFTMISKDEKASQKMCRDCVDATFHPTGSTIWVSCRFVVGWRDVNSKCALVEEVKP